MILSVGLTGGIASGKSTIMRMFAELGCVTCDADTLVAELYRPGRAGHDALLRTYGTEILRADGEIDRKKLADIAFVDARSAYTLNALIHPIVIAEQERLMREEEQRRAGEDFIYIVEATLLIESGGRARYDKLVIVDVDPAVQLARGVARGMEASDVQRRIANQMSREQRLHYADYVIDNSGDEANAKREVRRVYDSLRADLANKKLQRL